MMRWQKIAVPHLGAGVRQVLRQHDERRQVRIKCSKPITEPRTDAGQRDGGRTGVHRQRGLKMLDDIRVERADDAQIVGAAAEIYKQLTDPEAGFPSALEFERRTKTRQRTRFISSETESRDRFAMQVAQLFLRIERVQMRNATGQKNKSKLLCACRMMRSFRREHARVADRRGERQPRQRGQRTGGKAAGRTAKKMTAREMGIHEL